MASCPTEPVCGIKTIEADPDIAGIGVILAFLISAWSSLIIVTIEYFSMQKKHHSLHLAPLDELFKNYFWKLTKSWKLPSALGSIQPAILLLSDQQLVTGIAIMSVGYIQHCTMTQYHFYIVYLLGFVSCQVFDASLQALAGYRGKSLGMRSWRAGLMTALFAMVILNTFVTDNDLFGIEDTYYGSSIQCVWNGLIGTDHYRQWAFDLAITLIVLFWEYLGSMWLLYPQFFGPPFEWVSKLLRLSFLCFERLHNWIQKWTLEQEQKLARSDQTHTEAKPTTSITNLCHRTLIKTASLAAWSLFWLIFIPFFTLAELLRSNILSHWRTYSALLWATIILYDLKQDLWLKRHTIGNEDEWKFGQLLPLFLLILPVMSILEVYQDTKKDAKKEGQHEEICSMCRQPVPQPTDENIDYQEPNGQPLRLSCKPTDETTDTTDEGDYRLPQRQDTEARIGVLDDHTLDIPAGKDVEDEELELPRRMYESTYFKVWVTFITLSAFGATTYGAVEGYAL